MIVSLFTKCIDLVLPQNPVTKCREFHIVPECTEQLVGSFFYPIKISAEGGYSEKRGYHEKVKSIGRRIAQYSDRPDLPYEFSVVDSRIINAWCLPGGKICFYYKLIKELDSEGDEFGVGSFALEEKIASIMAHEITHACARHSSRSLVFVAFLILVFKILQYMVAFLHRNSQRIEDDFSNKGISDLAIVKLYAIKHFFDGIYRKVFNLLECHNSREYELEADRYGMVYLQRAGYNPKAAIWLQEFFAKKFPTPEGWLGKIYSLFLMHPTHKERALQNRKTLKEIELKLLR